MVFFGWSSGVKMSREKHWRKLVPQCLKQIVSSGMVLQALDVIFLVKFHEIANSTLKIFKFLKIFPTIIRIKKNIGIFSLSLELGFGLFFKWLLKFTDVDLFSRIRSWLVVLFFRKTKEPIQTIKKARRLDLHRWDRLVLLVIQTESIKRQIKFKEPRVTIRTKLSKVSFGKWSANYVQKDRGMWIIQQARTMLTRVR